jgi:hypothetical protein
VLLAGGACGYTARRQESLFRTKVDLVVLSLTVSDNKGHYINNSKPADSVF